MLYCFQRRSTCVLYMHDDHRTKWQENTLNWEHLARGPVPARMHVRALYASPMKRLPHGDQIRWKGGCKESEPCKGHNIQWRAGKGKWEKLCGSGGYAAGRWLRERDVKENWQHFEYMRNFLEKQANRGSG